MSPAGRTSLVIEMPCATDDDIWHAGDEELVELAYSRLADIGFIHDRDILSTDVKRLNHAYPVLETGFEENMQGINDYLARFKNLKLSGRNGRYEYAWIHDMMRFGKEIIEEHIN